MRPAETLAILLPTGLEVKGHPPRFGIVGVTSRHFTSNPANRLVRKPLPFTTPTYLDFKGNLRRVEFEGEKNVTLFCSFWVRGGLRGFPTCFSFSFKKSEVGTKNASITIF
jgi:hypothetical protein